MDYKIIFSKNQNKKCNGVCQKGDRNSDREIIIYKNAPDKLKTLIHELIHDFLFEKSKQGYKSRVLNKINDDEVFVDSLATQIAKGISSVNKDKLK